MITSVTIINAGSGYTMVPTVTFTGTGCTTGTLTPSIGLAAVVVTNPGTGYSSSPNVTISGGGGTGATATAHYAVNTFGTPYTIALDANDDLFVGSRNISAITGTTGLITGISLNGSSLFASLPSTTYTAPRGIGIDTLGHAWVSGNKGLFMVEYGTATGNLIAAFPTSASPF